MAIETYLASNDEIDAFIREEFEITKEVRISKPNK